MRLLSAKEIVAAVEDPDGPLQIGNFQRAQLAPAAYYVRVGRRYARTTDGVAAEVQGELADANVFLDFAPGEYVRVWSLETFRLDATVLGMFGGATDTVRQGLSLVAGLSVDPLYPGSGEVTAPLEFGVKNQSHMRASIRRGDVIAKLLFFDVSDSAGMELLPGSPTETKFAERRLQARDAQLRSVDLDPSD
jgi:deoxycytidine triphosphate deaminase